MPLDHVRILNALLVISALVFLCVRLASWFGIWAAPAFTLPLLLGSDLLIIPLSTNQTLSLVWVFFSVGVVAGVIERFGIGRRTLVVVFAMGAIANYFDLLINPPLAPALIAFLVMWHSLQERQDGPRRWRAVLSFGACVTAWFSGYSLAWGAKWLLAAAILGVQTAAPDILNQIWMRTYGGSAPGASPGIFTSTIYQFKEVGLPLFAACWGVAGARLVSGAISGRVKRGELADFAVLQLPLVIPVIWVMILRDHSIMHANFVSRSFVLYAALPLLSALGTLSDSTACRRQPHGTVTGLA